MQVDENVEKSIHDLRTSGGWIYTMMSELINSENVKNLVIVSVNSKNKDAIFSNGKLKIITIKANGTRTWFRKTIEDKICQIIKAEEPDITDIQGIEFVFSGVKVPSCYVTTIQGIPFELYKYQKKLNLYVKSLKCSTVYDVLRLRGLWSRNLYMRARAVLAEKVIKQTRYVIGRTEWDKAVSFGINPKISYYSVNRIIRDSFYEYKWNALEIEKYSIFTIGFSSINKGFDILIKALTIIVNKYPETILYVPGKLDISPINGKWYDRYIWDEIVRLGMENNIKFLGALNAEQMAERLSKSHVFVSPSLNENSSNAIAEAQIVGIPVVATYTGGNTTYVTDNETGLLYSMWDEFMCAHRVIELFEDEERCLRLSQKEHQLAIRRHDKDKAVEQLLSAYSNIVDEYKNKRI